MYPRIKKNPRDILSDSVGEQWSGNLLPLAPRFYDPIPGNPIFAPVHWTPPMRAINHFPALRRSKALSSSKVNLPSTNRTT